MLSFVWIPRAGVLADLMETGIIKPSLHHPLVQRESNLTKRLTPKVLPLMCAVHWL